MAVNSLNRKNFEKVKKSRGKKFKEQLKKFLETNNKDIFIDYLQNKLVQNASGRSLVDKVARASQEVARENIKIMITTLS